MTIIGVDFSINKPAACVYTTDFPLLPVWQFYGWPYGMKQKMKDMFEDSDVTLPNREDDKEKGVDVSDLMRYGVKNSEYLSDLIRDTLMFYLNNSGCNPYIVFEGLSYASSGAHVIQLGAYKYMLMHYLSKYVPLDRMYTYSPATIKNVAGCSKRGMGKPEMIQSFIDNGPECKFKSALIDNPNFKSGKNQNWIMHVDDIVDSYFIVKTLILKENIGS
jgi:hypothetical protein